MIVKEIYIYIYYTDWLDRRHVKNCYNRNTYIGGDIRIRSVTINGKGSL